jgi:hypothetical protein
MYTTYHWNSAEDVTSDLIDSIKATFKNKPITIIVEEDSEWAPELSYREKQILEQRVMEDETEYLTSDESVRKLRNKYGL